MMNHVSSRIMRTTLDLDPAVLRDLKRRAASEGKSLGRVASELLATTLATAPTAATPFRWSARPMHLRVDLDDKEAVRQALDRS
jgi:hypothetical protein